MHIDYPTLEPPERRHSGYHQIAWVAWLVIPVFGLVSGAVALHSLGVPLSEGYLMRYVGALIDLPIISPFTFAISVGGIVAAGTALWQARRSRPVGIILPLVALAVTGLLAMSIDSDLNQAKEDRIVRENRLSMIGQDLRLYARDTYVTNPKHKYPPTFKSYLAEVADPQHPGILDLFDMKGVSYDQKVASFDDPTCPYGLAVYVGGHLTEDSPGSSVVMYERLKPDGDGIYVLHVDHSVTWLNRDQAKQLIASYANYKPPSTQP